MLDVRDANLIDLRGRKRVGGEDRRLVRPLDDVNLLAAKLADDGLHARTLHADARADGVNVALGRGDCDLRALARFAHSRLDDDRAVINLRHFHLEEALQEFGTCARGDDLRAFRLLRHVVNDDAYALALIP